VLVVISTEDRQVLLMERTDIPGFWQSVTGSLEPDEQPSEAAARELQEETGLEFRPRDLQHQVRYAIKDQWLKRYAQGVTHNTEHWFEVRLESPVEVHLNDEEHTAAQWLPVEQALDVCSSASNRAAIKQFVL
jgi:dihydroneopterin triphosphate diphosphatase